MNKYNELIEKANVHQFDLERKSLFWILGNNKDLYSKINHIYDFKDNSIKPECLESSDVDFSSSSRNLIKLAFNLYNSFPSDVVDTFSVLDEDNFEIAIKAIRIRFNHV